MTRENLAYRINALVLTFFNFEFSILESNIDWQYSSIGLEHDFSKIGVESSSLSIVTTVFHCVRLVVRENSWPLRFLSLIVEPYTFNIQATERNRQESHFFVWHY